MVTASELCAILQEEARRKDISGKQLAKLAGLSQAGVAKVLRGAARPSAETLITLVSALGRDLTWLQRRIAEPKGDSP